LVMDSVLLPPFKLVLIVVVPDPEFKALLPASVVAPSVSAVFVVFSEPLIALAPAVETKPPVKVKVSPLLPKELVPVFNKVTALVMAVVLPKSDKL